jgi:serine/threonine protein kinase
VWKCEAPGGLFKAIKFVHGDLTSLETENAAARQELQAMQRVKLIRHPFILSMERVEIVRGQLVIVTELADRNLFEVQLDYRASGIQGIPRRELLNYLREAAEALDWMNLQFGLQHLDIKPRNLFLVSKHVKVGDFGLVTSLWEAAPKDGVSPFFGMTTPPYSSPELFRGGVSPFSDQYSLAIVYQELLTGTFPFKGKNARQLAIQHDQSTPDLAPLPATDRPIAARALAKDPRQRFPSCSAFIEALSQADASEGQRAEATARVLETRQSKRKRRVPPTPQTVALPPDSPSSSMGEVAATPSETGGDEVVPSVGEFRAGLEFLACVDHTPLCEVWKVRTLQGRLRMAKFSQSFGTRPGRGEQDALKRLATLAHPALLRMDVADRRPGSLILVMDLPAATLGERLQEYRAQGLPGLPRWELLEAMRRTAEGLDYLWLQHGMQHLMLHPNAILMVGDEWVVADAGLMHWLWSPIGHAPFQLNALYSAPELYEKRTGPGCDQYSLALIYLEMLTGRHPHLGRSPRQLARLRREGKLNLDLLPVADRPILERALHPDPTMRFKTCTDLVAALESVPTDQRPLVHGLPPVISSAWSLLPAGLSGPVPSAQQLVTQLLSAAASSTPTREWSTPSSRTGLQLSAQFQADLELLEIRRNVEAFCAQWQGRLVCTTDDLLVCHLSVPRGFWRNYFARPVGLEIQVHIGEPMVSTGRRREIGIQVGVFGADGKRSEQLLSEIGPVLVNSLRTLLKTQPEQRGRERLICDQPLTVYPVICNFELGPAVECRTRDVSLSGIGFLSPHALAASQIYLNPTPAAEGSLVAILAQVVRMIEREDGYYEVGAFFRFDESETARSA